MGARIFWMIEKGSIFLIFLLSLFVLGDFLFQKLHLKESSRGERVVFSMGLGIDFFYSIIFVLSLLKIFYVEVVIVILVFFFLFFPRRIFKSLNFLWGILKDKKVIILFFILLPFFMTPFYPPIYPPSFFPRDYDATWYHFPIAKEYIKAHSFYIIYRPDIMGITFPHFTELIFAFLLKTGGWVFTHLFEWTSFLLSVIVAKEMGSKFSREIGIMAGIISFANPCALYVAGVGYVEGGLMFYSALACFSFILFYQTGEKKWIVLTALFAGSAGTIKYNGLFYLPWLAFGIFVFSKEERVKNLFLFSLLSLLFPFLYLLRNFMVVGNPFHPFFAKSVGVPLRFFPSDIFLPFIPYHGFLINIYKLCGIDPLVNFHYFLLITLSPFFVFLFLLFREKWLKEPFLFFALFSLFYTIVWCSQAPEVRYLQLLIPQNALLISMVIIRIFSWIGRIPCRFRFLWIIFLILLSFPAWVFIYKFKKKFPQFPPPDMQIPYAYLFLNSITNEDDRIYAVRDDPMRSCYNGDIISYFNPSLSDPIKSYEFFRSIGAKYFLAHIKWWNVPREVLKDYFFDKKFLIVYAEPDRIVFKVLSEEREEYDFSSNLLLNSSFKEVKNGKPSHWYVRNFQLFEECEEERNCILLPPGSYASQKIPVPEKSLYIISHCSKTLKGSSSASLRVNWYKEQKAIKPIRADKKMVPVRNYRECNSMYVISPPDAKYVDFYLYTNGPNDVLFDSPSLKYIKNYAELLSKNNIPYPYSESVSLSSGMPKLLKY